MLKPETNEKLQDVAYDIEQALKAIGDNPSSYDLGLFEGKMIGLSVMLNAVAADIDAYCQYQNSDSKMEWIPYDGQELSGPRVVMNKNGLPWAFINNGEVHDSDTTHYLMLPELPKQENVDAKN